MALEGSLRDFDLFSLFNMIKTQGKSGTLVLSRSQEFVKIYFDQGEIVGCDSNQVRVEDRVGAMLVRLGRLSGDELLGMIQKQRQTLKRLGVLLLESGKVSAQDLQDALFNQAMSLIYRTFRWVEGDYRFDSMLSPELDREHFPPIPVDTVLMEAARIMDEWPEVQRRLPAHTLLLQKSARARELALDLDQELSGILDGTGSHAHGERSGLSYEQEVILLYFSEPQTIQNILQITRYDELDTCKYLAELLEQGLLEACPEQKEVRVLPVWQQAPTAVLGPGPEPKPSALLWVFAALLIALPLWLYVPRHRASINQGLASLRPADRWEDLDQESRERLAFALRLASPQDGGAELARRLGLPPSTLPPTPSLLDQPDPMAGK